MSRTSNRVRADISAQIAAVMNPLRPTQEENATRVRPGAPVSGAVVNEGNGRDIAG